MRLRSPPHPPYSHPQHSPLRCPPHPPIITSSVDCYYVSTGGRCHFDCPLPSLTARLSVARRNCGDIAGTAEGGVTAVLPTSASAPSLPSPPARQPSWPWTVRPRSWTLRARWRRTESTTAMCGNGRRNGELTPMDGAALRRWTARRFGDGWREGNWMAS
jgi:hypothetical protein